jgi:hypothetical protein
MKKNFVKLITTSLLLFNCNLVFSEEIPTLSKLQFLDRELNEKDTSSSCDLISGDISLEFNIEKESLSGKGNFIIENTNKNPISSTFFVLNSGLSINEISITGSSISETIKEKITDNSPVGYVIYFDKPIKQNQKVNLGISYKGNLLSKYKFGRIKDNDIFLTSQTYFYPRFEKINTKFSKISLKVSVPNDYIPVTQSDKILNDNNLYSFEINNINGLKNDNGFSLAIAKYKLYKQMNLSIYYKDETDSKLLKYISDFEVKSLSTLEELFGKHDYKNFNIAEVNRDDLGGMASANTIFLSNKNFGDYINKSKSQYDYFKSLNKNDEEIKQEYLYYLRNVLAHESVHLFFNYFFSYDKPWFAEGFPEFISLKVLSQNIDKNDINRKLYEYDKNITSLKKDKLPSLNNAFLNTNEGYFINYWGTPLVFNKLVQKYPEDFDKNIKKFLNRNKSDLTYNYFKEVFNLDKTFLDVFEKEFKNLN